MADVCEGAPGVLETVLLLVASLIGLATGSWWSLLIAAAFGLLVGTSAEVEASPWFLGAASGTIAAVAMAAGVGIRRRSRS